MEYKLIEIESIIDDVIVSVQDAIETIETDIFGNEKPCPPYDVWIEKMKEAMAALENIRKDETFKTMLAEEEKQYDIDCDKADGQSY